MAWALVTGASTGIGEQFVRHLAAKGHNVVLVSRRKPLIDAVADDCRVLHGVETEVIQADLCTEEGLQRVKDRLSSDEKPVDLLVNNAGLGVGAPIMQASLKRHDEQLCIMARVTMHLSIIAAHHMVKRGHGAICNLSSMGAYMALGTYSANKTWVDIFSQSLHYQLKGTGVTVKAVRPGFTDTGFFERMGWTASWLPKFILGSPRQVAAASLHAVSQGRPVVTPRLLTVVATGIVRIIPKPIAFRAQTWVHKKLLPL